MNKFFYSFEDHYMYRLEKCCSINTFMSEQDTCNGVLIYADDSKLELVEYKDGHEVEFDTRFIVDLEDFTAVIRDKRTVNEGE